MSRRGPLVILAALGAIFGLGWALIDAKPVDAWMYWTTDLSNLYGPWSHDNPYVYPPPLAMAANALHVVGWPLVIGVWTFVLFASTAIGRWWAVLFVGIGLVLWPFVGFHHPMRFPFMWPLIGNIGALLPALVILGLRRPWLWSIVAVTKVMPAIGALWFAFRGEWRSFGIAVAASLAIVAATFAIAPNLWLDWFAFATSTSEADSPLPVVPVPFPARVGMSLLLLWWGARSNRVWTVPLASGWAALGLYEWTWLVWIPAALAHLEFEGVAVRTRRAVATIRPAVAAGPARPAGAAGDIEGAGPA